MMSRKVFQPFKVVGQLEHMLEVSTPWYHVDGTPLTVYVWKSMKDGYWKASDLGCAIHEFFNRHGQIPTDVHFSLIEQTHYPGASLELKKGTIVATGEDFLSVVCAVGTAIVRFDSAETVLDVSGQQE